MAKTKRIVFRRPNAKPRKPGTLGYRLTLARQEAKISQLELGKKIKANESYIVKVETGEIASPRLDTIRALAKACGVEPAWIAFGTTPMRRRGGR